MDLVKFVEKVQAQLKGVEALQALANRRLAVLHETLSEGLEQFGPGAGCPDEVVASIITPKRPN